MVKNSKPYPLHPAAKRAAGMKEEKEKILLAHSRALESSGLIEKSDYQSEKNKADLAKRIASLTPEQIEAKKMEIRFVSLEAGFAEVKLREEKAKIELAQMLADIEAFEKKNNARDWMGHVIEL